MGNLILTNYRIKLNVWDGTGMETGDVSGAPTERKDGSTQSSVILATWEAETFVPVTVQPGFPTVKKWAARP